MTLTIEGFNPKAYRLMVNAEYDYRKPPSLKELNLEVIFEMMHGFNEIQKMLRRKGYRVSSLGLGFMPPKPIRVILKERKEKIATNYITVEGMNDERSKQPLPQRLTLDYIEPSSARPSMLDRIGITTRE
ncbi:hypothetical protein ACH5RR_037539 [Cinchona calisaya]|uniref:Uncharacterized protein n=1 Tax=Cinchona calisaya TaxID=153742 RepID=A0ABD2Y7V0_9GENT